MVSVVGGAQISVNGGGGAWQTEPILSIYDIIYDMIYDMIIYDEK
jgi:hypothetical protein